MIGGLRHFARHPAKKAAHIRIIVRNEAFQLFHPLMADLRILQCEAFQVIRNPIDKQMLPVERIVLAKPGIF